MVALDRPMVRMNRSIRCFCSAKTCSMRERILDRALLARRIAGDIGRFAGFLRWRREVKPFFVMNASFAADRYAVSAQTLAAVLLLSSRPSRSRRPSWAAASVVSHLRMKPKPRSIEIWLR